MDTPIIHVTPNLYTPEFETFSFLGDEALYPLSVESPRFDRLPYKLPNEQMAHNFRREMCMKFENGRYFNVVQYNVTLSHPAGLSEDGFHYICDRKDIVGRFFKTFTPLHTRCINDPICRTPAATYRENKEKTRLAFWKGLSDGIDIDDGRIKVPSQIEWSTYNFLWTRAKFSDNRLMMCVARFGNYADVGNPTIAQVDATIFEAIVNQGVTPTAPLELALLDKDGCEGCCP